ncbi:phosducin-like protein 3 isoform X2 [Camellia sinensis]|uniref:phosducin-like protein 3 isoform X2 n=1 Tax=Camellia sinensis TaxID=4442 RepID=UPI001036A4B6|nr:phosducin-like protein 3 isoform X2 [Camellia sinensis]
MANYHFVYKDVEGVSTQWDDIQRKLGDLPPKPPAFKPPSFTPVEDKDSKHKDNAWIDDRTEEQLEDLEDDPDLDDDRFLQEYRYHFPSSDSPNYALGSQESEGNPIKKPSYFHSYSLLVQLN